MAQPAGIASILPIELAIDEMLTYYWIERNGESPFADADASAAAFEEVILRAMGLRGCLPSAAHRALISRCCDAYVLLTGSLLRAAVADLVQCGYSADKTRLRHSDMII